MNNAKNLLKNPRIIIFILAVLGAIFAIHPGYTSAGATSHLHYGLDLEGGSWLQLKLEGTLAQIDADPEKIVSALVEPAIGSPINITNNNLQGGGSANKYITFTTSTPINASQIEKLGLGANVSVDNPSRGITQVTIASTSKEFLIQNYLAKSLDTEVDQTSNKNVLGYEIKKSISEKDLEALMEKVGGFIVKNQDGTSTYKEGVSTETRDSTRDILNDKLNAFGLKDIPVRTVGEDYIQVDFAGIDLATAKKIVDQQGKFEIRIQTTGNETQHVVNGDSIVDVRIISYHDNQWHVPFTLSEEGARALQKAALETGAVDNPEQHYLNMYLDQVKVYGAPLNPDAASKLRETPMYTW